MFWVVRLFHIKYSVKYFFAYPFALETDVEFSGVQDLLKAVALFNLHDDITNVVMLEHTMYIKQLGRRKLIAELGF